MSWLWDKLYGGGSGSGSGDFFPPMEGGGEGKDQTPQVQGEGKKWTGFDPTGLERAAKAARELDQSREYRWNKAKALVASVLKMNPPTPLPFTLLL